MRFSMMEWVEINIEVDLDVDLVFFVAVLCNVGNGCHVEVVIKNFILIVEIL